MSASLPHFEIRRSETPTLTAAGNKRQFWVRIVKNKSVFDSPLYVHKAGCLRAIGIACGPGPWVLQDDPFWPDVRKEYMWHKGYGAWLEIRDLT